MLVRRHFQLHMNSKTMFFRTLKIAAFLSIALVLVSCSSTNKTPITSRSKVIEHNALSGAEGTNGPILVVKIDDTPEAHPQIGLDKADVVYIEEVEGGLTRLAAVFSSEIPARIGPVRSARISDIDLLAQFGHVAFAFSGAQSKLFPVIDAADLENLGAQHESAQIYTRDSSRNAPVNMVLQAELLMSKLREQNTPIATARSLGWSFGASPTGGRAVTSVVMQWPANSYSASWSDVESRWLLNHSALPDMADSGTQLGASTLVIQLVAITASQYHDKGGGVTPFSATVGSGSGYILRDGKAFDAHWIRPNPQSGTTWTLADGSHINFAPGQIWVALTDSAPKFTYPIESASPSPTK